MTTSSACNCPLLLCRPVPGMGLYDLHLRRKALDLKRAEEAKLLIEEEGKASGSAGAPSREDLK